jgi:hypothetical protein
MGEATARTSRFRIPEPRGALACAAPLASVTEMNAGPNGLSPAAMSAAERLAEVARLLAVGLVRLNARQAERDGCAASTDED